MVFGVTNWHQDNERWMPTDLTKLPRDHKRILSVQFREFIHHLEDNQSECELTCNPRVINFLERCYTEAA